MDLTVVSGLIVISYLAFLAWDVWVSNPGYRFAFGDSECYDPARFLERLGVHTDEHTAIQGFSMPVEARGSVTCALVISGGWTDVGMPKIYGAAKKSLYRLRA